MYNSTHNYENKIYIFPNYIKKQNENLEIKNDLSLEWKLLNVEYFLKTFSNYAK